MNITTLSGNLDMDVDNFYTQDGMHIASFSLAFRSTKDKTSWIKVTCFKKLAEIADKYLHKGARIAVSGILDQDKWETDDGESRSSIKLIANSIEFIKTDGRGFDGNESENDDVPF